MQTPASFSVTNIVITPVEAQINETVTITAEITNTGGTSGNYLAVLRLNDIPEAQTQISIPAQGKEYVSWQIKGELGNYFVSVGEMSASYTVLPLEDSTPSISTGPSERLPALRGMLFTSERAISQVWYYLFEISKANDRAEEYFDDLLYHGEFTADFQYSLKDENVNGHKHTGWVVSYKLTKPFYDWEVNNKDYWKSLVWMVCKDGYIYESTPETKKVTDDINLINSSTVPTYYLFPAPYFLIHSTDDEAGDCKAGYIDIIKFETWRENSLYTFILYLQDDIEKDRTAYEILIDCDHSDPYGVSQGVDYIVALDYKNDQIGLLEKDINTEQFTKIRDFEKLKVENNKIEFTIDLQGIAFTWPGFQASASLLDDAGATISIDTSHPWWYK